MKSSIGLSMLMVMVLATGCRSVPVTTVEQPVVAATSQPSYLIKSDSRTNLIGESSATVDKMAKQNGCDSLDGSRLNSASGVMEDYLITCTDGRVLGGHCEYRQCQITVRSNAIKTGAPVVAAVTPTPDVTYPPKTAVSSSTKSPAFAPGYYYASTPKPSSTFNFVLGLGITAGGDKLATITFSNGSTSNLYTGTGAQLVTGVEYRSDKNFSVQGTVNFQASVTSAFSNGSANFTRVPIEFLGYYHINDEFRLGGGVRFVEDVSLNGTGIASSLNQKFNHTTGAVVEAEYLIGRHFGIKLRAVKETYTPTSIATKLNGEHLGIFGNYYF